MTEVVKKEGSTDIEEKKEETPRKRVYTPDLCMWLNDEGTGYDGEVYLPGVERDSIKLKMEETFIYISGETERTRYAGAYSLCCPIDPEKATSTYKEGLLAFHVPFKEPELHIVDVEIN